MTYLTRTSLGLCSLLCCSLVSQVARAEQPPASVAPAPPPGTYAEPLPQTAPPAPVATAPATTETAAPAPTPASATKPADASAPADGKLHLQIDPIAPPVVRTSRLHDGFYVRTSVGLGTMGVTIDTPRTSYNLDAKGDTLDFNLLIGGSPSPGVAIGGTILTRSLPSADFEYQGTLRESDVGTVLVGGFVDGFPNPRGGFHLGGAVGLAQTQIKHSDVAGFTKAGGIGLAGWVGYDLWVGDQWSVGGQLQMMGTRTNGKVDDTTAPVSTRSAALMMSVLYH